MNIKLAIATGAVAAIALVGCSSSSDDSAEETTSPTMEETMDEAAGEGTIVDVASENADFTTLVDAVVAADLVDTLNGEGPFTVFAPTNEAFAALPAGVLEALLLPENQDVLVQILTYHVVPGEVTADMVEPGEVATVEGSDITITANDGGVQVNGANVVATDVMASNGVIHVIDAVILPPGVDPAALLQ